MRTPKEIQEAAHRSDLGRHRKTYREIRLIEPAALTFVAVVFAVSFVIALGVSETFSTVLWTVGVAILVLGGGVQIYLYSIRARDRRLISVYDNGVVVRLPGAPPTAISWSELRYETHDSRLWLEPPDPADKASAKWKKSLAIDDAYEDVASLRLVLVTGRPPEARLYLSHALPALLTAVAAVMVLALVLTGGSDSDEPRIETQFCTGQIADYPGAVALSDPATPDALVFQSGGQSNDYFRVLEFSFPSDRANVAVIVCIDITTTVIDQCGPYVLEGGGGVESYVDMAKVDYQLSAYTALGRDPVGVRDLSGPDEFTCEFRIDERITLQHLWPDDEQTEEAVAALLADAARQA